MATKNKKPLRKAKKTATPVRKKPLTAAEKEAKLKREIAKRNRLFSAASAEKKRVLIARDVIAQIKLGRFKAKSCTWVTPYVWRRHEPGPGEYFLDAEFGPDAPVRELFLNKQIQSCDCCALGAIFMSCTLYNNNQTAEEFEEEVVCGFDVRVGKRSGFSNGLNKFFSAAQLRLIETAFEGGHGAFSSPGRKGETAMAWQDRLPDDKKRLVAIMENIIENNGTFVP